MPNEKVFKTQGVMGAGKSKKSAGMIIGVLVLLGLLFGGGGVAVWAKSATDPLPLKVRTATLHIEKGTVMVKLRADSAARPAKSGELLVEGMTVTTGADTEAELRFYDNTVARLAPETELTLETLVHDDKKPTEDKVGISVEVGRVWSRVLNLLSLNAEYTVKSSTTVATVRGTAFDFAVKKDKNGKKWTHVNGADSLVDCKAKKWQGLVKKGEWLHVPEGDVDEDIKKTIKQESNDVEKTGVLLGDVLPEAVDTKWSNSNDSDDKKFLKDQEDRRRKEADNLARPFELPVLGAVLEKYQERRLESASGAEKEAMLAAWAERKIGLANRLAEKGNDTAALAVIETVRDRVEDVSVETAALVQQNIDEAIGHGDLARKLGDKLLNRMPELKGADRDAGRKIMKSVLLENRLRDMEEDTGEGSAEEMDAFEIPEEAFKDGDGVMKQRFDYLRDRRRQIRELRMMAKPLIEKELDVPTSDGMKIDEALIEPLPVPLPIKELIVEPILVPIKELIVEPIKEPIKEPIVEPIVEPVRVELIIEGRSSMQAGDEAQYRAIAVKADGTRKDVTAEGSWSVSGTAGGTISAGGFYTSLIKTGTDVIVFSGVGPDGLTHTAKKSVLIEPQLDFAL